MSKKKNGKKKNEIKLLMLMRANNEFLKEDMYEKMYTKIKR